MCTNSVLVCRYIFTNSLFLMISEPNSRRAPCVGRVWLAQAHTQAFQTPPSTLCVPHGQVGPRPSPKSIALACLQRAVFIQTCVMCVFARLVSKNITRACGMNFRALFTHPQTKPRALNTAPHLQIPSKKSPTIRLCGTWSNMQLGTSA
jgi:hypothetical protein